MNVTTGEIKPQKNLPPRKSITKININPNLPRLKYLYIISLGKKDARTFDPSKGGIGMRLNTAKKIFIYIAKINIFDIKSKTLEAMVLVAKKNRPKTVPRPNAMIKLVIMPARDVYLIPFLKSLK